MSNAANRAQRTPTVAALKSAIISVLGFEDLKPEDIEDDAELFGAGMCLDSIDAAVISVLVDREYGVNLERFKESRAVYFKSISALHQFVVHHIS